MYWHGPMMGWGWMPFSAFFPLVFLIILAVGVLLLVRLNRRNQQLGQDRQSAALDALDERYARGEIGREEYLQKKSDIGASAE